MKQYNGLEIAVIGMSGRFPGANNINSFWENLKNGVESINFFTDEELINEGEEQNLLNNPLYVKANAFIKDKEYFDSSFFNYRPDEAKLMDPQMRVFHECVWEAIENAGCNLKDSNSKIGIFASAFTNINWVVHSELNNRTGLVDNFTASQSNNARFLASKISYCLNLHGPSMMIDTACSSSLVAIHQACKSLLLSDCKIAIAGGVTIRNESKKGYLYAEGMVHSRDGHCRTFDAEASGTVGGEGAAVVVLKTLKNAIKDGDHIWAIIKGSGVDNDGNNKVGYAAPSIDGQTEAIMMAQKWAKTDPESISLIEAHGTATELGDPIEVEALGRVFGKSKDKYCAMGSVKTNIGHLDSAAGAAGFIKAVLALKNRLIPPSLNFKTPNPKINFKDTPFYINTELKEWKNDKFPLRAGVSSFGMGGTNVHAVLEEAPEQESSSESREYQLLVLSAKTQAAFGRNVENLKDYLKNNHQSKLSDIAYTLQLGRTPFNYRKVVVCTDRDNAIELLSSLNVKKKFSPVKETEQQKIVFMFSGQGSQYINMCYDLYKKEEIFKNEVDRCFNIVNQITDKDIKSIVFPDNEHVNGNKIHNTEYTQPLLFIIEYALVKLLMKWGINPDIMIGHSFGEYVAACISGVFSLDDALFLIVKRGELMQKVSKGKMLGISISEDDLQFFLNKHKNISLATVNSSELCVVSGNEKSITNFKTLIEKEGYACKVVPNSHAYHSNMMDGILDEFEKEVNRVKINKQQIPFISNLTGKQAVDSEISKPAYWVNHLRHTVKFSEGINTIMKNNRVVFIEVGPGVELSVFVRSNKLREKEHKVINLVRHQNTEEDDLYHLLSGIGKLWQNGVEPDWNTFYANETRRKVPLPAYSFEKIKYPVHVNAQKMISKMVSENTIAKDPDITKWFYKPTWKLSPIVSNTPTINNSECILIFADNCEIGNALIEKYKESKKKIVSVKIGKCFLKVSPTLYEINPNQEEGYKELFLNLSNNALLPDCIIHSWGITKQVEVNFSETSIDAFFYSLLEIVKSYQAHGGIMGKEIVLLTNDLHPILNKEKISSIKSLSAGLLKVISQEYQVSTSHIDISLDERINIEFIDSLYKEIQAKETGKVISFRHAQRWEQIYDRIKMANNDSCQSFKKGGVYLITGGLGNFGFNIAIHLLREFKAKVILLGSMKLPKKEEWTNYLKRPNIDNNVNKKINRLQTLMNEQGEVLYLSCNLSNTEEMAQTVKIAEEKLGPLNGIVHAAGVVTGRSINSISDLQKQDFEIQFAPKIMGLQVLKRIMENKDLDFCMLISSLSPILGGIGLGAYSPANTFMDYYVNAHSRQGELKNWISLNIDGIDFEQKSTLVIDKEEVFEVLKSTLSVKELPQVIASATNLHKRLEKWVYKTTIVEKETIDPDFEQEHMEFNGKESGLENELLNPTQKALVILWQNFFGKSEIALDDHFFDIGGDSLKALTIIQRINKAFNVQLAIVEFFKNPSILLLGEYIDSLKGKVNKSDRHLSIPMAEIKEYYRLSPAQNRLYFLYKLEELSLAYVLPMIVKFEGYLDKEKLSTAFSKLIARHEILRTSFNIINSKPVQKVMEQFDFNIEFFQAKSKDDIQSIIKKFVRPFDLSNAPLIKVGLIETSPEEFILIFNMHHIITDGVSEGIILNELAALYNNEELPQFQLQYKDYAEWHQNNEQQSKIIQQKNFWVNEFSEELSELELPTDFPRLSMASYEGASIEFKLSIEDTRALKAIAETEGATLYMVLLSIYNILLSKLSNKEDIVIGTPVAGRQHVELENMIGMFVNTLPLRNYPRANFSFKEFLSEVKSKSLACFDNQAYQYEELIDELKIERDTSHNPLFDTMFVFQGFEVAELKIPGLVLKPYKNDKTVSKFDITLTATEADGHILLDFEYSTKLFRKKTIERFITYFRKIVSTIIVDIDKTISAIEIITEQEKHQLLFEFNATQTNIPQGITINNLIESQTDKTPEQIAAIYRGHNISYKELGDRSNQLARYLEETGVANNSPIPIYCDASIEFLISMIAVFKAGGTYIPIDVNFPIERLNDILEDSGAQILISKFSLISDLTRNSKFTSNTKLNYIVNLDNNGTDEYFNDTVTIVNLDTIEKFPKNKIEYKCSPEDLSYMIYTSGTTGKPKGVMIHHLGMLNHLYAKINDLSIVKSDIVAQTASISFDISVWQFLAALIVGGKIHIIEKEITLQPVKYLKTLQQGNITILESVPSLMTVFLDITKNISNKSLKTLRWMIPTGEALGVSLVRKWYESYPKIKLLNAYGPTEASDDITHYIVEEIPDKHATSIPIGKPIQNMHLYILNDHLNLCPVGVIGEICVSGLGVGKGYWKDIKKTEKAFIKNPYYKQIGDNKHSIVYKTGDLGYFREDGNIECLGRKDYQVKINGYRIELGEIESQLAGHHQIKDTAVIVKEKEGNKYIVAYYVSEKEIEVTGLREYLSKKLPDYMIPTYYVYLTSLPLTHNGKINKKALPEPEIKAGENYKPPSNEIEERLVEIWSEVLAVDKDKISINSNFFEIGGNSINLLRVHSMINEEFKSNISVANMFSLSNIYALADFIANGNRKINELEEGLDEREEALSFLGENR